jgi:hypothetical protein
MRGQFQDPWVLKLHGEFKFVNQPGSERSYTDAPHLARRFESQEKAAAHACGNETPVRLLDV